MLENLATSRRESDYSSRMNRCTKQGNNTAWGMANTSTDTVGNAAVEQVTTMRLTDTCWSKVEINISDRELERVLREKNINIQTSWWAPAGGAFKCGEQLGDKVFSSIESYYTAGDFSKGQWFSNKFKGRALAGLSALAAGGAAAGATYGAIKLTDGFGGNFGTKTDENADLVKKRDSLLSQLPSTFNASNRAMASGQISGVSSAIENAAESEISALKDLAKKAVESAETAAAVFVPAATRDTSNNITNQDNINNANATLAPLVTKASSDLAALRGALQNVVTADKNAGNLSGWGQAAVATAGLGVGIATYATTSDHFQEKMDAIDQEKADSANAALLTKIEEAVRCTIHLRDGGTKKIGLGDIFVLPPL